MTANIATEIYTQWLFVLGGGKNIIVHNDKYMVSEARMQYIYRAIF